MSTKQTRSRVRTSSVHMTDLLVMLR